MELYDEVSRLKVILEESAESKDVNQDLLKELKIKDEIITERNKQIVNLQQS